jgi:release factor glutamine methyltransferase
MMNSREVALSVATLLTRGTETLSAASIDEPRREARLLLREILGVPQAWIMSNPEADVDRDQQHRYLDAVRRRAGNEPAAYILGHKEFFGLDLEVEPCVLIPRPETELLVEQALQACERILAEERRFVVAADLGTGSGAVAIALAARQPRVRVVAVDGSTAALDVARRNARRLGVDDRIDFRLGDLLEGVQERFDLVVANLPYVPSYEVDQLMPEVSRFEPRVALDGGPDGMAVIRRALEQTISKGERPAAMLFEIGEGQGGTLSALARALYPGAKVRVARDYAGLERILSIELA